MILRGDSKLRNIYTSTKIQLERWEFVIWTNNFPSLLLDQHGRTPLWLAKLKKARIPPSEFRWRAFTWKEDSSISHLVPSSLLLKQSLRKCGREVENSFLFLTPSCEMESLLWVWHVENMDALITALLASETAIWCQDRQVKRTTGCCPPNNCSAPSLEGQLTNKPGIVLIFSPKAQFQKCSLEKIRQNGS